MQYQYTFRSKLNPFSIVKYSQFCIKFKTPSRYFCSQMCDSAVNQESIIVKHRLKNLYSYSKQSLAPAVSTVGFFFLLGNITFCPHRSVFHEARIYRPNSGLFKKLLSCSVLMCITYTLMNNILFLLVGQNRLMISTRIRNGKKS